MLLSREMFCRKEREGKTCRGKNLAEKGRLAENKKKIAKENLWIREKKNVAEKFFFQKRDFYE